MTNTLSPPTVNDWLAGYSILSFDGSTPGDLDVYASQAFNFLAQPPYLLAVQTVVQSFASNAWVTVSLDTVVDSNNCAYASSVFTANQPGWYGLSLFVEGAPPSTTQAQLGFQYSINGQAVGPIIRSIDASNGAAAWTWGCYDEVYLNSGDTAQGMFWNFNASAFNSTVSVTAPYANSSSLEIAWLSE
jgi:hypothetical protein